MSVVEHAEVEPRDGEVEQIALQLGLLLGVLKGLGGAVGVAPLEVDHAEVHQGLEALRAVADGPAVVQVPGEQLISVLVGLPAEVHLALGVADREAVAVDGGGVEVLAAGQGLLASPREVLQLGPGGPEGPAGVGVGHPGGDGAVHDGQGEGGLPLQDVQAGQLEGPLRGRERPRIDGHRGLGGLDARGVGPGEGVERGQPVEDLQPIVALSGLDHFLQQRGGSGVGAAGLKAGGGHQGVGQGPGGGVGGDEVVGHLLRGHAEASAVGEVLGDVDVDLLAPGGVHGAVVGEPGILTHEAEESLAPGELALDQPPAHEIWELPRGELWRGEQHPELLKGHGPVEGGEHVEHWAGLGIGLLEPVAPVVDGGLGDRGHQVAQGQGLTLGGSHHPIHHGVGLQESPDPLLVEAL